MQRYITNFFKQNTARLYVVAALVVFLLVYVPVKRALRLGWENHELSTRIAVLEADERGEVSMLAADTLLLQDEDYSRKVFSLVGEAAKRNNVLVKELQLPISTPVAKGQLLLETNTIVLQGEFANVLKSLDQIRDDISPVKIASLKFERTEINRKPVLLAQVRFQHVKANTQP